MAYMKRTKYTVSDYAEVKDNMLDCILQKGIVSSTKARQLVYYPTPMTLIRWSKYLTAQECAEFLVPYEEDPEDIMEKNLGI